MKYLFLITLFLPFTIAAQAYSTGGSQCGGHGSGGCYPIVVDVQEVVEAPSVLQLFPNPNSGDLRIDFRASTSGQGSLRLIDPNGRIILQKTISILKGNNYFQIDISNFPDGAYEVQLNTADEVYLNRLLLLR